MSENRCTLPHRVLLHDLLLYWQADFNIEKCSNDTGHCVDIYTDPASVLDEASCDDVWNVDVADAEPMTNWSGG